MEYLLKLVLFSIISQPYQLNSVHVQPLVDNYGTRIDYQIMADGTDRTLKIIRPVLGLSFSSFILVYYRIIHNVSFTLIPPQTELLSLFIQIVPHGLNYFVGTLQSALNRCITDYGWVSKQVEAGLPVSLIPIDSEIVVFLCRCFVVDNSLFREQLRALFPTGNANCSKNQSLSAPVYTLFLHAILSAAPLLKDAFKQRLVIFCLYSLLKEPEIASDLNACTKVLNTADALTTAVNLFFSVFFAGTAGISVPPEAHKAFDVEGYFEQEAEDSPSDFISSSFIQKKLDALYKSDPCMIPDLAAFAKQCINESISANPNNVLQSITSAQLQPQTGEQLS